jgi:hypothetical protein
VPNLKTEDYQGISQHAFTVRLAGDLDRAAPQPHDDHGAHRGRGHQPVPARHGPAVRQAGGQDENLLAGQGRAVDLPVHQDQPAAAVPVERPGHRRGEVGAAAAAQGDAAGRDRLLRQPAAGVLRVQAVLLQRAGPGPGHAGRRHPGLVPGEAEEPRGRLQHRGQRGQRHPGGRTGPATRCSSSR